MFLFRIIPGVLWLDILDKATDQCQTFLGWRLPCSLTVLFAWMSFLGELRVQVVNALQYITVVYYRPNKVAIKTFYGKWQIRLAFCAVVCAISYYFTFEFADDFPYLQELKASIQNERYNQDIDKINQREVFLMAHVFVQRFLQQAQAIVWILGTLLRLKRKRFLRLAALVWVLRPLGSFLVAWCGNYALWLLIGHTLLQAFDLVPEGRPRMGSLGCYAAVIASTIYWRKYGTVEILVAVAAAVATEIAWMNLNKKVQTEKEKIKEQEKPSITHKAWVALVDLVTPDDEAEEVPKKKVVNDDKKNDDDKSAPDKENAAEKEVEIPYSYPSFYSWLAIVVYWAAVGIKLDGYDLTTL